MKEHIRENFDVSTVSYAEYEARTGRFGELALRLYDRMADHGSGRIDSILDAGAGSGISARAFEQRGATPVALDLSRQMLRECSVSDRVQGDFDNLPFRSDTFDAVAFTASLFLAPNPKRAVTEARRVLRAGGTVGAVAPLGWRTTAGEDVFAELDRDSRSPADAGEVEAALASEFDLETGTWTFEATGETLRLFHAIPAIAARLYPRLDAEARVERAQQLLADVEGPLEERWRWFVGR
jgi:cyclopropane-fatty-acyl-phospholipid synthase